MQDDDLIGCVCNRDQVAAIRLQRVCGVRQPVGIRVGVFSVRWPVLILISLHRRLRGEKVRLSSQGILLLAKQDIEGHQ